MSLAHRIVAAALALALGLAMSGQSAWAGHASTAIVSGTSSPERTEPAEPSALWPTVIAVAPALPIALVRSVLPAKNLAQHAWANRRKLRVLSLVNRTPVTGELSSPFGTRRDPLTHRRRRHKGIDFDADRGDRVWAAGSGRVVLARRKGSYGRLVIIDHGFGVQTRYAHLRRIAVHAGELVDSGQLIGRVGSSGRATGAHLHFEIRVGGKPFDPTIVFQRMGLLLSQR